MNKNPHTSPPNKRKEILRLLIVMPIVFVLLFAWLGLVILVNKMGLELSAERVLLGIAALLIGGVWAWLNLKGKKPFAQAGEALPYPLTGAQNPVEKLMRGLFLLAGIMAYVAVAMMPETMASSFLRIFSSGHFTDVLGLLALLAMVLVIIIYHFISITKHKLLPHTKPKEKNPYISWYLNATMNWIQFLVMIIWVLLMVYRYMKS